MDAVKNDFHTAASKAREVIQAGLDEGQAEGTAYVCHGGGVHGLHVYVDSHYPESELAVDVDGKEYTVIIDSPRPQGQEHVI